LSNTDTANGKVIEMVSHIRGSHHTYAPKITFTAKDGKDCTFVTDTYSYPPAYSVGQNVNVIYNLQNPSDAKVNSFFGIWGEPLLVLFWGLVVFIIGLAVAIFSRDTTKNLTSPQ
jgi:hypothetical protein